MDKRDDSSEHPVQLDKAVQQRRSRLEERKRQGETPLLRSLAAYGSLGWLIVLPALGGVYLGRYIDKRAGTGLLFTAGFLCIGVALGSWMAWRRMHEQP